ncbi:MAG: porin family protein [Puia sp.]|nr:porin family protein [Puia sp.]
MTIRSIVLCLAFPVITVFTVHAQDIHFGVKAGGDLDKLSGRSFTGQFKWGYSAGGFAEIGFGKWGFQPELAWSQTNLQTASDFNVVFPQYGGLNSANVQLNYLTIPLLVTYRPLNVLSVMAGPQFGYLINREGTMTEYTNNEIKKGDISVVGGFQLNLSKFRVGARYFVGLNQLNNLSSSLDSWKNQGLQIYLGYRIR